MVVIPVLLELNLELLQSVRQLYPKYSGKCNLKPLSHQGGILTATARRARKTQNTEVRTVRSPRAPRDRRGISTGRRGVS